MCARRSGPRARSTGHRCRRSSSRRRGTGRILLIGDAAHAVAPHLAQGAGTAMEDALVLAEELDAHSAVPDALAAFMQRRLQRVQFVQHHAHEILLNEMESDAAKKAAFAERLGDRQAEIAQVLAKPA